MKTITAPKSAAPTLTDWLNYCRWGGCGGPLGTYRQYWVASEAQEVALERTGRFVAPNLDDFAEANRRIPATAVAPSK